jgi:hypothetical protein
MPPQQSNRLLGITKKCGDFCTHGRLMTREKIIFKKKANGLD